MLLFAIVLLSFLDVQPVVGKRGFGGGHSYPKSGGLSGGGSHGYPKSGGLSGGGRGYPSSGGHGYPSSSGGLSGGGHGYPSSGGNHGYPQSGGRNGYPSSGGSHGYPSSGGNHGYPSSGGGLSGNSPGHTANKYPSSNTHTTINNHYHYTPPQQIRYVPPSGGPAVSYPVYRGTPPTYVYQIKDSGSKYGTLLTGLALLNLGALAGTAYAVTHSGSGGGSGGAHYTPQPGEVCKFGVKKDNGDYEETKIDCKLISSFILQEEAKQQNNPTNTTIITTVTNVTTINMTNGVPEPVTTTTQAPGNIMYIMLANGTLVPVNGTAAVNTNTTAQQSTPNNTMASSVTVTTTTTNTTVTNALDVKGKPIDVTPGMQCFVMRTTSVSRMRKSVPCGVLQTYAEKSIKKNAAGRNVPVLTLAAVVIAWCLT